MSIAAKEQATSEESPFAAALNLPPDRACGGDAQVRQRRGELLKPHCEVGSLI
jgi:hypothetical protein